MIFFKKKQYLYFESGSNTIRQLPENYLIAHFQNGYWICDPDLAARKDFAVKVFKSLFKFENKYQTDGQKLVDEII